MQNAIPSKITNSAAIQMKTQISNMMVIQNLQEYLKYLILTTSVEPQSINNPPACFGLCSVEPPAMHKNDSAVTMEEEKPLSAPQESEDQFEDSSNDSSADEADLKRKKSQKLFSLMQKKLKAPAEPVKGCQHKNTLLCPEKICLMANTKKVSKARKMICGHSEREHYAKGLCGSCYLRVGRTKKPWNCPHDKLYALGLCQKCYAAKYNKLKKVNDAPPCKHTQNRLLSVLQESNTILKGAFGGILGSGSSKLALEQKRVPYDADLIVKMENN